MRQRSRWRAVLAVGVAVPVLGWVVPSIAGPSSGARQQALALTGGAGAIAVKDDGTLTALGDASVGALRLSSDADVVDAAATRAGVLVVLQADGTVTSASAGALSCAPLIGWWPAVAFALTPDERGAWIVAGNGDVAACGTATVLGEPDGPLGAPVVDIAAVPGDTGYVLVTASGEVRAFGAATAVGDGSPDTSRFVAAAATAGGYWLARADGAVQAFGDAPALGDVQPPSGRVVDLAATADRAGYRVLTSTGAVLSVGPLAPLGDDGADGAVVADDTFEAGTPWTTWWGPPLPAVVADAHTGSAALSVPGHWRTFGNVTRTIEGLVGGRTYELSYWVKGGAVVGGQYNWSPLDWSNVVSGRLPRTPTTAGAWTRARVQLTAPAGAQRLWLGLVAADDFVLDDVQLRDLGGGGGGGTPPTATTTPATTAPGTTAPGTTTPATTAPGSPVTTTPRPPDPVPPPGPPPATTLPPAPAPAPRVGKPPSGPDEIDARSCGASRLLGGPISAAAAAALYPGRRVVTVPAGDNSGDRKSVV